jgi:hypothetical protein
MRMGTRYGCPNRSRPGAGLSHSSGYGKPSRKFCAGCHGELYTEQGRWGVFTWQGHDGRYRYEDAESTYISARTADRHADTLNDADRAAGIEPRYVVRWIPEQAIPEAVRAAA